jgi:hypothetical protein
MKFFPGFSPGLALCAGNFGWEKNKTHPHLRRVGRKLAATHTPARDYNNRYSTASGKFA